MGIIGKDFKYKVIDNFLTKEEKLLLSKYCKMKHRLNATNFELIPLVGGSLDTSFYGDTIMESLLLNKRELMEKETGKTLLPTYSYWRMYTKLAELQKHKDRPACEISVTVNIDSDGTSWPIFMDDVPLDLKPGQAAVYLGCELVHHREEFQGDYSAQCFMHYVDANGKNKDWVRDQRIYWSTPSVT